MPRRCSWWLKNSIKGDLNRAVEGREGFLGSDDCAKMKSSRIRGMKGENSMLKALW